MEVGAEASQLLEGVLLAATVGLWKRVCVNPSRHSSDIFSAQIVMASSLICHSLSVAVAPDPTTIITSDQMIILITCLFQEDRASPTTKKIMKKMAGVINLPDQSQGMNHSVLNHDGPANQTVATTSELLQQDVRHVCGPSDALVTPSMIMLYTKDTVHRAAILASQSVTPKPIERDHYAVPPLQRTRKSVIRLRPMFKNIYAITLIV